MKLILKEVSIVQQHYKHQKPDFIIFSRAEMRKSANNLPLTNSFTKSKFKANPIAFTVEELKPTQIKTVIQQ